MAVGLLLQKELAALAALAQDHELPPSLIQPVPARELLHCLLVDEVVDAIGALDFGMPLGRRVTRVPKAGFLKVAPKADNLP